MRALTPTVLLTLLVVGCNNSGTGGMDAAAGSAAAGSGGHSGGGTSGGAGGSGGATAAGGAGTPGGRTYSTAFPLTENPISEGGNWINGQTTGLDWHDMSTTPGLAIGHQSGSSYTDGTALLTGSWGPTQTVEALVHAVNPQDSCYQEVEMRLRSTLTPHSCTGYEISFKATKTSGAYLIIVRWNGKVGDFTYLLNDTGAQYGVTEGDVVKATIVGNVITAYLNGTPMGTATDATYTTGSPGMGMNLETSDSSCSGTNGDYGFTHFTATGDS
jgi:hypothetical protein